jgi:hypothetical protein
LVKIIANDIPKTAREGYKQITPRGKKMKTTCSRPLKVVAFFAIVLSLLLIAAPAAFASAGDHIDDGLVVSKSWVGMIDDGEYDESYEAASGAMHDKVQQDRWSVVLKALRGSWGPVLSRQQLSHVYKPNGFEGTEGEFLVITYDTSFKKLNSARELVVLRWEDGKWRGAGYNAGPKVDPNATPDDSPASNSTDIQTQEHVKPVPQQ